MPPINAKVDIIHLNFFRALIKSVIHVSSTIPSIQNRLRDTFPINLSNMPPPNKAIKGNKIYSIFICLPSLIFSARAKPMRYEGIRHTAKRTCSAMPSKPGKEPKSHVSSTSIGSHIPLYVPHSILPNNGVIRYRTNVSETYHKPQPSVQKDNVESLHKYVSIVHPSFIAYIAKHGIANRRYGIRIRINLLLIHKNAPPRPELKFFPSEYHIPSPDRKRNMSHPKPPYTIAADMNEGITTLCAGM